MEAPSPSRLAQPLVSPGGRAIFKRPRRSVMQSVLKAFFVLTAVTALITHAVGVTLVWQITYVAPAGLAILLVLSWKMRPGWTVPTYSTTMIIGLVFLGLGNAARVQPPAMKLVYLTYLCYLIALAVFTIGFWAPSVRVSQLADVNVDTSSAAIPSNSASVPLQVFRLAPVAALIGGAAALWRTMDWDNHPDTVPVSIFVGTMGIMVWRAWARVGYRVPVATHAKVKDMLKRSAAKRIQEWEHVEQQYAALTGAIFLCASHCVLAADILWHQDDMVWVPYTEAALQFLALALFAASVPGRDPPLPSLRDPSLCPEAYDGMPLRVLMILPDRDFDVTEVAVPWFMLRRRGHEVVFATEHGTVPAADPLLLTGVLCGQLGADPLPKQMYFAMENDPAFLKPITWQSIIPDAYDGLILPGGHAPGMRQYLGSTLVQRKVLAFWKLDRPIGAICHGVLVLARTSDPETGKSVLNGSHATCLPQYMEDTAFAITCCCRGRYYKTYPATVQSEVKAALGRRGRFIRGPVTFDRGTPWDNKHAFVVQSNTLITSRWPGDAYLFARRFMAMLEEVPRLY